MNVAAADENTSIGLIQAAQNLRRLAQASCQRRMLVLSGDHAWCLQQAQPLAEALALPATFWFGDKPPANVPAGSGAEAAGLLGSELDLLVFDVWSGFDADAFGALTGCLRGGGLLVLLVPPSDGWKDFDDPQNRRIQIALHPKEQVSGRYLQRLSGILRSAPYVSWWKQNGQCEICEQDGHSSVLAEDFSVPFKSADQQRAVAAVVNVVRGHRRRPVVLTSDRGRGKSAAFGIAAAQLIQSGCQRILLTAPRRQSVSAIEDMARRLLSRQQQGALEFVAPDELLRHPRDTDLLLVDEAAGVPSPLLEALLRRYSRIAFASTVHGYEGTGRGFAIRFTQTLDRYTNSWKSLQLTTPVRWSVDDPLEPLVFRMLLLDADPVPEEALEENSPWQFEQLDRDQLVNDEQTLNELFGLLVAAHYRTRPFDVRHLLDGPNLSIYIARLNGRVVAATLLAREGGFDKDESKAIWAGRRRPRGHLLPEVLAAQLGLMHAAKVQCARIMRIAVHPALRRRGIGSEMLEYVEQHIKVSGCDYIGASFGLNIELLEFWKSLRWQPVWLSTRRGSSSGSHSAVFLKPLNLPGQELVKQAGQRFSTHFVYQLGDHLKALEPFLACALLQAGPPDFCRLDEADWLDICAFAFEQRMPEVCSGSLWKLACRSVSDEQAMQGLSEPMRDVLILRILQTRRWQEVAACLGVPGRAQALEIMRSAAAKLYDYHNGTRLAGRA